MHWPAERHLPLASAPLGVQRWLDRSAVDQLPARQLRWTGASVLAGLLCAASPLWATQPELVLAIALGAGAASVEPRRLWAAPVAIAGITLAGWLGAALGLSPVTGAALAAGAVGAAGLRERNDPLDLVHGALGSLIGAALGGWAAAALLPATASPFVAAPITAGLVGVLAAQGLVPAALRYDRRDRLPSVREIHKSLRVAYRPPVFKAIELYAGCNPRGIDSLSRRGLEEVAAWVFRLQVTLQARDQELAAIDPDQIRYRIDAHRAVSGEVDPSTRDPRAAAAHHLERLLEHRAQIELERTRTEALADYALAYLEEARAGLALARDLPGDAMPEGLADVLTRLRGYADEGHARRKTARELNGL